MNEAALLIDLILKDPVSRSKCAGLLPMPGIGGTGNSINWFYRSPPKSGKINIKNSDVFGTQFGSSFCKGVGGGLR